MTFEKEKEKESIIDNNIINNTYNNSQEQRPSLDFSKIKIGLKTLEDAVYTGVGDYRKVMNQYGDKRFVLRAIYTNDLETLMQLSDYFYRVSGVYQRLCRYMAYMYRYDWFATPYVINQDIKKQKLLSAFSEVLEFLDNFQVKKVLGEIALKVVRHGCFYGYIIKGKNNQVGIQQLPRRYCRSRFTTFDGQPVIEFNLRYFDDMFRDTEQRLRMLELYPPEFAKAYKLYKMGELTPTYNGDTSGWYLLDVGCAFKFNMNGQDFPMFASVIPAIIDLDNAQGLDRKKMQQQLLKILIQKMPINKDGDLVFDIDEAQQLHNNAVKMLSRAVGIDVLTTFADVAVEDMADNSSSTSDDAMERAKNKVFDESGVSQKQFNTDGNMALEKSILNDAASMYNLIQQFEGFLNRLVSEFNNGKRIKFRVQILPTTIYNYQKLATLYKEGMQLGYSKMLFQVALGHSQSSLLATAYFENEILDLVNVFIPPLQSSTMNAEMLDRNKSKETAKSGNTDTPNGGGSGASNGGGRPTKPDDQKSQKTIQNLQSQK